MLITYTTREAAAALGISDSRVRQLLIRSHEEDGKDPIGTSHGSAWLLVPADMDRLRSRVDRRTRSGRNRQE